MSNAATKGVVVDPKNPSYANLHSVLHSLTTYGGLVATDRPDLHNLDTDRDKNTVFEIDTQNEIAMVEEAIELRDALVTALQDIIRLELGESYTGSTPEQADAMSRARLAIAKARNWK
jgi:hypothetical protein